MILFRSSRKVRWIVLVALSAQYLHAQGCASCYTTAAAAKEAAVRGLRHGILILLFPPLMIFCGIVVAMVRSKSRDSES